MEGHILGKIFESPIEGVFYGDVSDKIIEIISKKLTNLIICYSDKTLRWVMFTVAPADFIIRTENFFIAEITKAIRTHGFLSHAMFFSRVPDYIPIILNDHFSEYSFRVQNHGKLGTKVLWTRIEAILGSPFSVSLASAVRGSTDSVLVPKYFLEEDISKWLEYANTKYPSFHFSRLTTKEGQTMFHFIKIDLEKEEEIAVSVSKLSGIKIANLAVDYFNEPFLEKLRNRFPEDEISVAKTSQSSWIITISKKENEQAITDLVNYIGMNPKLGVLFWKKSGLNSEAAERCLETLKQKIGPIYISFIIMVVEMFLKGQEKKIFTTLFSRDQENSEDVKFVAELIETSV